MAQVTSGAETWVPHTHRHHHSGGTEWLFGPDGPASVSGDRQTGPDDDDEVVTSGAPAVVTAMGRFPGTALVFDHWLVFDTQHQHVTTYDVEQLTPDEGTSGYAVAVYVDPTRRGEDPAGPMGVRPLVVAEEHRSRAFSN